MVFGWSAVWLGPAAEAGLLGELGVEGVDNVYGNRHRQAVPDAELGDLGDGCAQGGVQADGGERDRQRHAERERVPDPVDPPADQRDPMARSPATPSVSDTTIKCRHQDAGAKKLCTENGGPAKGVGEEKNVMTGCRRTTDMTAFLSLGCC